jgi:hypothetical protein
MSIFGDEPGRRSAAKIVGAGRGEKEKEELTFAASQQRQNVHCGFIIKPRKFDQ